MTGASANHARELVVVAAAVIQRGNRFLVTKRVNEGHLAGRWEFPGGKLEEGETPQEAVVRECREECAIEISVRAPIEVVLHDYGTRRVLLLFFACDWVRGEVQHLEVADHRWVELHELREVDLPEANRPVVARLIAQPPAT